ncbi:hypothetical protein BH18ACT8_BH18ACT8_01820 [soil metagenome]
MVVIAVVFSVLVQGSTVSAAARLLGIRMHVRELEPWALSVRLRDEPDSVHRFTVEMGSPADGVPVADLSDA